MLANPVVEGGHYTYKLHTRDVPPTVLRRELEKLLGESQWQVEMRHNVYNIQCCTSFNIKDLLSNCQKGTTSTAPRTFTTPRRLPEIPRIHLVVKSAEPAAGGAPTNSNTAETEREPADRDAGRGQIPVEETQATT